jgi:hypothetical protein
MLLDKPLHLFLGHADRCRHVYIAVFHDAHRQPAGSPVCYLYRHDSCSPQIPQCCRLSPASTVQIIVSLFPLIVQIFCKSTIIIRRMQEIQSFLCCAVSIASLFSRSIGPFLHKLS